MIIMDENSKEFMPLIRQCLAAFLLGYCIGQGMIPPIL